MSETTTKDQWDRADKVLTVLAIVAFILLAFNPVSHLLTTVFWTIGIVCIIVKFIYIGMLIRIIKQNKQEAESND